MGKVLLVFPSGLVYRWLRFVFVSWVRGIARPVAVPGQPAAPVRSAPAHGVHAQVRG